MFVFTSETISDVNLATDEMLSNVTVWMSESLPWLRLLLGNCDACFREEDDIVEFTKAFSSYIAIMIKWDYRIDPSLPYNALDGLLFLQH